MTRNRENWRLFIFEIN